jgi:hypothetical protein
MMRNNLTNLTPEQRKQKLIKVLQRRTEYHLTTEQIN